MSNAPPTSVRDVWRDRLRTHRGDLIALALLLVIPVLLYVPGAITGSPALPGDDLTQNEPLRWLAGEIIRSGRLPGWDPLIWSGTPLLAGWNAGAMFPATWLFAVFPGIAAWTMNIAAVPVVAGLGTYAFLRLQRCGPLAASCGALLFTYTGFMNGQIVHIGLTEGTALIPWVLLALELVPRAVRRSQLIGAVVLGGAALGLIVLAGDPRAISSALVILGVDLLALLWRHAGLRVRVLGAAVASAALGAFFSAVQWLPGIAFLHSSQRNGSNYSFYASGSLGLHLIAREMLLPFLTGGNGNFGQPIYEGTYNLPELTIGVGIVALVAGLAYLPEVCGDWLQAWRRQPSDPDRKPLARIYVLIVLGLVLTLGGNTPFGHLFAEIPLFGSERLQNRNALIFDFALVWLTALFVEERGAPLLGSDSEPRTRGWPVRMMSAVPPVGIAVLVVVGLIDPNRLVTAFDSAATSPAVIREVWPYLAGTLVLAVVLAAFVLAAHRCTPRVRGLLLACFVLADVATYLVNIGDTTAPAIDFAAHNPLSDQVAAAAGPHGRFAIYNPAFASGGPSSNTLLEVGVTDLNIVHNLPSVQGYGSIVNGVYQNFTGTHLYEELSSRALIGESANTLDLSTLLTLPTYLDESVPVGTGLPIAMPADATHTNPWIADTTPHSIAPLPYWAGPWTLAPGKTVDFTLPTPIALKTVTAFLDATGTSYPSSLRITTLTNDTPRDTAVAVGGGGRVAAHVTSNVTVNYIEISNPTKTSAEIGAVLVDTPAPSTRLLLDGALEGTLSPTHWRYTSMISAMSVFSNPQTLGLAWLQRAKSKTPNTKEATNGTVHVLSDSAAAPQVLSVDATQPSELVRSEGYSPGWSAILTPAGGGPSTKLGVHRFGLVQAISVPAGQYTVTFHYAPTTMFVGFLMSAFATLLLLVALVAMRSKRMQKPIRPR